MTLEELLARAEIKKIMAIYNTAGDGGRRDEFASVFTEDAVLAAAGIDCVGRDDIVDTLFAGTGRLASPGERPGPRFVRHHLTTCKLSFDSATLARGRTYFMVITDVGLDHSGVYTDEFRKTDDGWKIHNRQVRIDYVSDDSRFAL